MRVVFDTNTVVSAQFWFGAPRRALDAARADRFTLIVTETLIEELRDVLSRPKFKSRIATTGKDADTLVNEHVLLAEMVQPAEIYSSLLRDADDLAILACAVGGQADCIVSGDDHLLELEHYDNIPIWTVNEFLNELD